MIKRTVASIIAVIVLMTSLCTGFAVNAEDYSVSFWAAPSEVSGDGTVEISVYVQFLEPVEIGGMQITLDYSSTGFTYKEATENEVLSSGSMSGSSNGRFIYTFTSDSGVTVSDKMLLFTVKFTVPADIEDGNHSFFLYIGEIYAPDIEMTDIGYFAEQGCDVWTGPHLEIYPDEIVMPYGTEVQLWYNDDEKLVDNWYSTNSTVASVDETGKVTLNKIGKATIIATGGVGGMEQALCKVEVTDRSIFMLNVVKNPNKTEYAVGEQLDLTGMKLRADYDNYDIEYPESGFTPDAYDFSTVGDKSVKVFYKNSYVYVNVHVGEMPTAISSSDLNVSGGYITGAAAGTVIADFLTHFPNGGSMKLFSGESEVTSGIIATGMTAKLIVSGNTIDTATVVVDKDINADGVIDVRDLVRLKKAAAGMVTLGGAQLMAASGTTNAVTAADVVSMKRKLIKVEVQKQQGELLINY